MKPVKFDFATTATPSQASNELTAGNGQTKLVAGAQSLGPMLNLRLVRPTRLVDISMMPELREVRETDNGAEIGAAITHAEIEDGEITDPTGGWLRQAAGNIAHRAVRNRGTLGGSLAHADPAADWVIVMTGLGATILIDGPSGRRDVAMTDFITGPFTTSLQDGEIISAVRLKRPGTEARWGYWKFARQVGEFAKASATVLIDPAMGSPRVAVGALGRQPLVLSADAADDFVAGRKTATNVLSAALPDKTTSDLAMHAAALNKALELVSGDGDVRS